MWIGNLTRKEVLEVFELQGPTSPIVISQRNELPDFSPSQEYTLVWNKDPRLRAELPVMMLVARGKRDDFLAWAATYLPNVKPLTAFCRVLERGEVLADLPEREPALDTLEEGCLGLIFGETLTYRNGRSDPGHLSSASCARTYSFAMSRSLAFRLAESDRSVSESWRNLKKLTKQPESSSSWESLDSVWSIFLAVSGRGLSSIAPAKNADTLRKISPNLVEATWVLCNAGKLSSQDWKALTTGFPELSSAIHEVQGTREERVRSLDKYLITLEKNANRDPLTAAFIAGYLTSQVSPGSFDHASLLLPHAKGLGAALLWYGLCAGLRTEAQLKRHSAGLGLRVLRDLLRSESVLDRPRCDIAISELEVVMRGESNHVMDLRTNTQGFLEVEIAPRISTLVSWPQQNESVPPARPLYSQQELRALVTDLNQALLKTENVRQRLSHLLDVPKLYEDDYRKKKR